MGATPEPLTAADWAARLLRAQGFTPPPDLAAPQEHPAAGWARSGLMALTGRAEGEPQLCPAPLTVCADGALAALAALAPPASFEGLRGSDLLAERAAIFEHIRRGAISPGGSCRLLEAADGRFALNLARDEDWDLLPAWLEADVVRDWDAVAQTVRTAAAAALVARGRELGLALACAADAVQAPSMPAVIAPRAAGIAPRAPLVIDLSTLWAGPLCAHLLQKAGARVIKVESLQRPDGARRGPPAFFDLMNAGKQSVALDFSGAQGRAQLRDLLVQADIVIESARPRALRQLGIRAEDLLRENPRLTWIALSGYGRGEPQENWIAYGDDAGVAAGLSRLMHAACGEWLIVGDAIADPLAGLHAALAAWCGWRRGGGGLVPVSLCDAVRACIAADPAADPVRRLREWRAQCGPALPPRARAASVAAPALGAHTQAVLAEFGPAGR